MAYSVLSGCDTGMAWTQIMILGGFDIYMLYIFTWHTRFYLVVSFKNIDSSHNWVYSCLGDTCKCSTTPRAVFVILQQNPLGRFTFCFVAKFCFLEFAFYSKILQQNFAGFMQNFA